jgi:hypothetical protein
MTSLRQETPIHSFSRTYLESFTLRELLSVASQLLVDLPEGFSNRALIIGEILDTIDERIKPETASFSPAAIQDEDFGQKNMESETHDHKGNPFATVRIPERYNITFIRALVRDPLWFFVFWEVKESLMERLSKMDDFDCLGLRVNSLKKGVVCSSYRIPVGSTDKAWYLNFPAEGDEFFVEICALSGGKEEALAKTRPFYRPKILPVYGAGETPIAVLSGIKDIPVLREKNRSTAK